MVTTEGILRQPPTLVRTLVDSPSFQSDMYRGRRAAGVAGRW